jgi:hypothetical protein
MEKDGYQALMENLIIYNGIKGFVMLLLKIFKLRKL